MSWVVVGLFVIKVKTASQSICPARPGEPSNLNLQQEGREAGDEVGEVGVGHTAPEASSQRPPPSALSHRWIAQAVQAAFEPGDPPPTIPTPWHGTKLNTLRRHRRLEQGSHSWRALAGGGEDMYARVKVRSESTRLNSSH